jgi:hypothetical protein
LRYASRSQKHRVGIKHGVATEKCVSSCQRNDLFATVEQHHTDIAGSAAGNRWHTEVGLHPLIVSRLSRLGDARSRGTYRNSDTGNDKSGDRRIVAPTQFLFKSRFVSWMPGGARCFAARGHARFIGERSLSLDLLYSE